MGHYSVLLRIPSTHTHRDTYTNLIACDIILTDPIDDIPSGFAARSVSKDLMFSYLRYMILQDSHQRTPLSGIPMPLCLLRLDHGEYIQYLIFTLVQPFAYRSAQKPRIDQQTHKKPEVGGGEDRRSIQLTDKINNNKANMYLTGSTRDLNPPNL